ncbi:MAG: hypothetical protein WC477_02490 [Patescibacteria group bacterium]
MLEHLFGSKTRVKLMALFLQQGSEPIFVREVTRKIGTQINAVRRELANLVEFGLIIETEVAAQGGEKRPGLKRKYYRLKEAFPLLPEVRSLMTKAQLLVEHRVDKILEESSGVRYVAFMGAFLGAQNSPIDLFIVGALDDSTLQRIVSAMEKTLGREINYTVMPVTEYQYRKDITDKFLMGILDAPKSVVLDRL